jgi:hypothetical protein
MKRATLAAVLSVMALLTACGGADEEGASSADSQAAGAFAETAVGAPSARPRAAAAFDGGSGLPDTAERLIVRTITISLAVGDIPVAVAAIGSLAAGMGGFVVSSQIAGDDADARGFISFRVPSERTDEALEQLRATSVRVIEESTRSQDVTEEYVDLQARLTNLERTEKQYIRLYDRADSVEDVLRVQRELTSVRGQIEQLKGRLQYLDRTSSTSLISVSLRPASSPEPLVGQGWSALETARSAVRGLVDFGQVLANVLIRVAVFAPVWAPIAALVSWLLWRGRARLRRRSSRREAGRDPSSQ